MLERGEGVSKFQWLKDYLEIEEGIVLLEYNLQRTKKELHRYINGDLQNVKLTAESDGAKLEERIEKIESQLAHKMNDLYDLKKIVNRFKKLEHQILVKKYIEGKTLEVAAEELGYTSQYIYNKHSEIRRMIAFSETY